jgi:spore maturation protein CgeB
VRIVVAQPGPDWSVHDVYAGWCEALRLLGHQVYEFNLNDRLVFYDRAFMEVAEGEYRKAVPDGDRVAELAVNGLAAMLWKVRPDVLLVVSGFFIPGDMLDHARRYGTKVVLLHTESPYEDDRQLELAGHVDLNMLNDPTNMAIFNLRGPTVYMPHAYRPAVHKPGPVQPDLASEFCFVGTGFPSRIRFLEAMNLDGIDVALAGNWQRLDEDSPLRKYVAHDISQCLDNADAIGMYQSAEASINLYRREADSPDHIEGWSMGPREVEMAACGLFFLRDPRPEGDQVLSMLPTFATPEDASEQLRWWLAHPDERNDAAALAREAIADRTFQNHAARMLRLIEN